MADNLCDGVINAKDVENRIKLNDLNFDKQLNLHQGFSELTSKQFYYVKVQFVRDQANFEHTRGLNLQPWHLQQGSCVP